ncbi:ATP-binding protein [Ectothiorhodospiraceae bacterium 2226]|nr:ATP-binding protein [Ectothiorhodospiraceae bacterium 2226]
MSRVVDVTLHVDEGLGPDRRLDITQTLRSREGVVDANFNDDKPHLMIVTYDADRMEAVELLDALKTRGVHGELIGL